jgi:replicative DNA helicase
VSYEEEPYFEPEPQPYSREMPHDRHAEMATLGGMLLLKDAVEDVTDVLTGGEFYLPVHEKIFDAIVAVHGGAARADAVTVSAKLGDDLRPVGGPAYLHTCMELVPTAASAGHYAEIVRAKWNRRRMIEFGMRSIQIGYETDDDDVPEAIDRVQADAFALTARHAEDDEDEGSNLDVVGELLEDIERPSEFGVMTGFRDFDELTGGLQPGQVIVVAARSGMGKSTWALDVHRKVSMADGEHSVLFSTEMGRKEILKRALSAEAKVSMMHMRPNCMSGDDWERLARDAARVGCAPLHIIAPPELTITQIRTRSRRLARRYPIKLITVDYTQQVGGSRRYDNRQQEVSEVSRGLKSLAKELNIPVIAVAQLNRGPESRADKRPHMSDLRESGSLEQDADVVVLPFRPDYYEPESPRAGEADLIIDKHRNGPKATITVAFQGHYSRFVDMYRESYSGEGGAR